MNDQKEGGARELPRLIYNSDGDSTTFITFPPPMTPEQACRDIEETADTAVEVFSNSMGRGDETFSHSTEFGEVYGSNVTEWPEGEGLEWVKWMADSTRALLDQGVNIIELLAARAHERGMQFWPTLRMNDIHEDDTARFGAFRSTFKKEHPELLIGSPYPTVAGYGYAQDDFTWAFNFARPEVRERKLGLILETCERYDIDGFEMDFQRGRWYFKQGQEGEGMPLMTDFMRKVRAGTAEIMRRRGRPFTLMLRVPSTREGCRRIGLDVPTWIREELAELFIPMDGGYLNMGSEIAAFTEIAAGTSCRIGGGLERLAKGYGYAGNDMLYAAASSFWHQGASCIYLFNYDCHRLPRGNESYSPDEVQLLREIHDPRLIARKNKRYTVSVDMRLKTPERGGELLLPCELDDAGQSRSFKLHVGDDVESARRDRALADTWLRVTCARSVPDGVASVSLNGQVLDGGHRLELPSTTTLTWRDIPVVQGENRIEVALDRLGGQDCLRIEGIELVIAYI